MMFFAFGWCWPSGSGEEIWLYLYYPLGEGRGPLFEQTWIPSIQVCFMLSLGKIGPVLLEKKKMWKVYRRTDNRSSEKLTTLQVLQENKLLSVQRPYISGTGLILSTLYWDIWRNDSQSGH